MFDENKKGAVRNPRTQCTTHRPDGSVYITVMSSPQVEEKFCNAYWSVAWTDVKELANMELVTEDVSFILASPSKLRISGHTYIAKIPLYINTAIIKKGDELLHYAPKVESKPHEVKPLPVLQVKLGGTKRQKTSGK